MAGDQHADLVVGREVHRADHPVATALAQPSLRGVQQRTRRFRVVLALEPPKQTPLVVLEFVEVPIDMGADATDRPPIAVGEEVLSFSVLEEGILALVQPLLQFHHQRRDPVGLVAIEPPRELDERAQLVLGADRADFDVHCPYRVPAAIGGTPYIAGSASTTT